eukprot:g339.t1
MVPASPYTYTLFNATPQYPHPSRLSIVSRLLQFAVCVDIYVQEVGNDSTITITRSSSSWSFYYDNVVVFAAYHVGPNSGTIEVSAQLLFLSGICVRDQYPNGTSCPRSGGFRSSRTSPACGCYPRSFYTAVVLRLRLLSSEAAGPRQNEGGSRGENKAVMKKEKHDSGGRRGSCSSRGVERGRGAAAAEETGRRTKEK